MRSLPKAAQAYVICIWGIAALLLAFALRAAAFTPSLVLLLFVTLPVFIAAEYFEVQLPVEDGIIVITVGGALFIFLAATSGPAGMVVVMLGTLIADALQRRIWYRSLFNAAEHGITYLVIFGVQTLLIAPDAPPFSGLAGIMALTAITLSFYTANALLVSTVVALATEQPLLRVYRESFGQVRLFHLTILPLGALLVIVWDSNPWAIVPALVPLAMTQRGFAALAHAREQSRQSAKLAAESQQLASRLESLLSDLQQKQDELLGSSKLAALGTFAAGIAHEFNNLLAGLLGFAELGLRSSDSRDKDEALQRTVTASMHGRGITAGLLTFARQGEPQRASHDLREAVSQALALVERDFQRRQIAVVRQIDEVSYTVCDLGQIIQVVLNLLSNARDAMAEQNGGMVRISLEQHGDQIELAISDSGHGIPEELQQQIFQPFMTTKGALGGSATPGTGLGLAISYGIIESHGGTITVRSKPGEGATFIVRLPVVDELALREQANERSAPTLEPLQLLVIDDDQLVREAMVALLKRQHHNVEAATSGEDALRLCGRQSFDVAICDPAMSGIAGVELIERLQMLDPLMGMVLVTGNPQSLWGGAVIGGHMPVLHKPCSADDLLWAIADASHARPVPKRVLLERRRA